MRNFNYKTLEFLKKSAGRNLIIILILLPLIAISMTGCRKRRDLVQVSAAVVQRDKEVIGLLKEIAANPGDTTLMISLASRYTELNNTNEAMTWLEKALKSDPYSGEARAALIKLLEDKLIKSNIQNFENLDSYSKLKVLGVKQARLDTLKSRALVRQGKEIFSKGDKQGALKLFTQACNYGSSRAYIEIIEIALKDERLLDAARTARDALIKFPESREILKLAARVDMKAGNYESAREILQKVKSDDLQGSTELFHTLLQQGKLLVDQKRYHEAIEILGNAEKIEKTPELSVLTGRALMGSGNTQSAAAAGKLALTMDPQYDEAYYLLGDIAASLQDLKGALETYKKVLLYNENNPEPHFKAARLYTSANRVDMAVTEMKMAIEKAPENSKAREQLGVLYARQGNTEQARNIWLELLSDRPDYANAYYDIALLNMKSNDYDNAVIMYLKALEIEPENPLYLYSLGLAYRQKGLIDESISSWKKVLKFSPQSKYAKIVREMIGPDTRENAKEDFGDVKKLFNYAVICEKGNRPEEAFQNYSKILDLAPDHSNANRALVPYYQKKGMHLEALVSLIILASKKEDVTDLLGRAYIDYGLVRKGMSLLKEGMTLDQIEALGPEKEEELLLDLARALEKRRAYYPAADKYIELASNRPDNKDYIKEAARIYIKIEDSEKALKCYERILMDNPGDTDALTQAGGLYGFSGNIKKGCDFFEKALLVSENDPDILIKYAEMLRNSRKFEEAAVIYRRAMSDKNLSADRVENIQKIVDSMKAAQ
jgi:tetratricopeptide (TPR) repeat protein